jgi:hypothetical protein
MSVRAITLRVVPGLLLPGRDNTPPAVSQPDAVGSGDYVGENVIAQWDVVPLQIFTGTLKAGICAFHTDPEGIAYAKIRANGGQWTTVSAMTLNDQTDVVEYVGILEASKCTDGIVVLQAVVYPYNGIPRVLPNLTLNANYGESLTQDVRYVSPDGDDENDGLTPETPMEKPITAAFDCTGHATDHATIYMLAGDYGTIEGAQFFNDPFNSVGWMTIMPAPGVDPGDIIIDDVAGSGFNQFLTKWKNLNLAGLQTTNANWYDGCTMSYASCDGALFITDCTFVDSAEVTSAATLIRNITVNNAGGDILKMSTGLAVNVTINSLTQDGEAHTNVWQSVPDASNLILYNISMPNHAGVQAFQANAGMRDVATVNCALNCDYPIAVSGGQIFRNILTQDCTFTGSIVNYGGFDPILNVYRNVRLNGSVIEDGDYAALEGVIFQ